VRSLTDIARREKIAPRYVERLSRLAFVAPVIVDGICQGRQPADLNAQTLLRIDLPLEWSAQPHLHRTIWFRDLPSIKPTEIQYCHSDRGIN